MLICSAVAIYAYLATTVVSHVHLEAKQRDYPLWKPKEELVFAGPAEESSSQDAEEELHFFGKMYARLNINGFWVFYEWILMPFFNWIVLPWYNWTVDPVFGPFLRFVSGLFSFDTTLEG